MPLRIIWTPSTPWRKRKAQAAVDSSGRRAWSSDSASGVREARRPPRTGSMTQMGMLYRRSSSHLALASCMVQSR